MNAREVWRTIPIKKLKDYQVSNLGRVRSLKSGFKIMSLYTKNYGHRTFSARFGDKRMTPYVGRCVLLAFGGNPRRNQECSHLDGNGSNDLLENLMWETHKDNMHRTIIHGTSNPGDKSSQCKWGSVIIRQVKERLKNGARPKKIAFDFGIPIQTIYAVKLGLTQPFGLRER
jgi:hypothetical protein